MTKKKINFIKVFIEVQSFINHLRIWECKCYTSIDTKFLFNNNKTDKLITNNKNRFCVFLDYDKNIITQYQIRILNRREIIKHYKITFSKNEKWKMKKWFIKFISDYIKYIIKQKIHKQII